MSVLVRDYNSNGMRHFGKTISKVMRAYVQSLVLEPCSGLSRIGIILRLIQLN